MLESIPPEFKTSAKSLLLFKPANKPVTPRLLRSTLNTNCSFELSLNFVKFTVKLSDELRLLKSIEIRKLDCELSMEISLTDSTFSITPSEPEELKRIGFAAFRLSENRLCRSETPTPKSSLK